MGVGIVLFFLIFFLTIQIYDQSKEIDRLELSDWKYRALRATLPSKNVNVIWLERNVWRGNDKGIHQCQQFVIRSTSGRLACPRTTRTQSVAVIRWNRKPPCVTALDGWWYNSRKTSRINWNDVELTIKNKFCPILKGRDYFLVLFMCFYVDLYENVCFITTFLLYSHTKRL